MGLCHSRISRYFDAIRRVGGIDIHNLHIREYAERKKKEEKHF
jgi:hypothetical protein